MPSLSQFGFIISRLSYLRLHRGSATPKKRPRLNSDDDDDDDDDGSDDESDEVSREEEEAANDTETTEEQADERGVFAPPAKRLRVAARFTCADLITAVRRHRSSWPFQVPVDPKEVFRNSAWFPCPSPNFVHLETEMCFMLMVLNAWPDVMMHFYAFFCVQNCFFQSQFL